MKVKDIPVLKQRVLDILPITQSELWKTLKIDHRDASELVGIMVKEHIIKKTKIDNTFMLESSNGGKKEKDFSSLISSSGKFSPCSGCSEECSPPNCEKLTEWLLDDKKMDDVGEKKDENDVDTSESLKESLKGIKESIKKEKGGDGEKEKKDKKT